MRDAFQQSLMRYLEKGLSMANKNEGKASFEMPSLLGPAGAFEIFFDTSAWEYLATSAIFFWMWHDSHKSNMRLFLAFLSSLSILDSQLLMVRSF